MAPQSRGATRPSSFTSKSTPALPTRGRLALSPEPVSTSPSSGPSPDLDINETSSSSSFSDSDSDNDNENPRSSSSGDLLRAHLPPSSSQLFPPFYNRPPTPLPPSPSLTSLLRPSFSTHTSHHTTPESSDAESAPGALPNSSSTLLPHQRDAAAKSAALPRASPKVPTYEYYGFALYLASSGFFLMYLLWSYLPSPFLHQLGIYYYPNRWWALAIPAWLVMLIVYIYVALASYNTGYLTLPMSSSENIVDEAAQIAILDREGRILRRKTSSRFEGRRGGGGGRGKHSRQNSQQGVITRSYQPANLGRDVNWRSLWNEGTDAVMDIPIGGVCEILYGEGREVHHSLEEDEEVT